MQKRLLISFLVLGALMLSAISFVSAQNWNGDITAQDRLCRLNCFCLPVPEFSQYRAECLSYNSGKSDYTPLASGFSPEFKDEFDSQLMPQLKSCLAKSLGEGATIGLARENCQADCNIKCDDIADAIQNKTDEQKLTRAQQQTNQQTPPTQITPQAKPRNVFQRFFNWLSSFF